LVQGPFHDGFALDGKNESQPLLMEVSRYEGGVWVKWYGPSPSLKRSRMESHEPNPTRLNVLDLTEVSNLTINAQTSDT
jgi:hypothetical protein